MYLHQTQTQVARDRHRFRVLRCGRRWGKSSLAIEEIKGIAISKPSRIAYIATNYAQARDIAWEMLKKEMRGALLDTNEARLEIKTSTIKGEESTILLRGWESIENLRGQAFDFLVIDEVAMMNDFWSNWQEVLRPTLTDRRGQVLFCSTPKGFNHFYDLCNLELKDNDFKTFHFTSWDNPHLPKDELETAQRTLPPERFAQEYEASFQKTSGLVYKEFTREKHLYDELPKGDYQKLAGIDFGYNHPAAVVHIFYNGETFFVDDEWYKRERTEIQIAEYVAGNQFEAVYPDPESPSAIEELRRKNINTREVIKGKDSVTSGIQKVRELLLLGRIKINKKCVNLISEFEMYSYDEGEKIQEKPIKEYDHACFTADTQIEFPFGNLLIKKYTGKKDVYRFMGSKVTADHPYLTQRGFIRLDALRYSDRIIEWKKSLLTEYRLDDTQIPRGLSVGSIFHLLHRKVQVIKQEDCIGICGKKSLEKSLKDFISIIKMVIRLITLYLISNWFHRKNIVLVIIMKIYLNGERILKKLFKKQANGLKLHKDKKEEVKSEKKTQNFYRDIKLKEIVINVVKNIFQKRNLENSATIIAKLEHCGQEDVYSYLTTDGFFTANGFIVSNCDALRYCISMVFNDEKITKVKATPYIPTSEYEGGDESDEWLNRDIITKDQLANM